MNTDKEINIRHNTFGPALSTNVPNATVTHYQLQLAKQQIAELKEALEGMLYLFGDLAGTRAALEYCNHSRAVLAKLDTEDKPGKCVI